MKIKYMLTGSLAMMLYSVYRMTAGIDIVVELKNEDVDRIINAFEPDYYVPHGKVRDAIAREFMFNVIHQETTFKIDLVIKKTNEFQQTAFDRRLKKDFYGKEIYVITLEDLIVSKLLWAKSSLSEKEFKKQLYYRTCGEHLPEDFLTENKCFSRNLEIYTKLSAL